MATAIEGHRLQPEIDKLVLENKSSREIARFCTDNGLPLSNVTVAKYIKERKDDIQGEVKKQVDEIKAKAVEEQVTTQMFLQALIQKGYGKLLNGDYDDASLKDIVAAARVLMPTQIIADVTSTITMEDVISTLSQDGANASLEDEEDADI